MNETIRNLSSAADHDRLVVEEKKALDNGGDLHIPDWDVAKIIDGIVSSPIPGSEWSVDQHIAAEIVASASPRKDGFNYGSGWVGQKPSVYFDGVRLEATVTRIAHEASARAWRLTTALRNVRLAETATERAESVRTLIATMENLRADSGVRIAEVVDELADTIEQIGPEVPKAGYNSHLGLSHIMAPLYPILKRLKLYLAVMSL